MLIPTPRPSAVLGHSDKFCHNPLSDKSRNHKTVYIQIYLAAPHIYPINGGEPVRIPHPLLHAHVCVCVCVEATCVRDAAVYFCTPSTCLYIQTRAFPASRPYVHTRSQLLCASSAVRFAFKTVHSLFSSPNQKKTLVCPTIGSTFGYGFHPPPPPANPSTSRCTQSGAGLSAFAKCALDATDFSLVTA